MSIRHTYAFHRTRHYTIGDTRYVDVIERKYLGDIRTTTHAHWMYLLRKHGGVTPAADALFAEDPRPGMQGND